MQRNFLTASGAYVQLNSGRARRYGIAPIAHSKSRVTCGQERKGRIDFTATPIDRYSCCHFALPSTSCEVEF